MTHPHSHHTARPASQARSRRTLGALLDALDRLLRDRPFESITVLELARAAKVSTGAFYARFASKEDLLPELYARYQRSLDELIEEQLVPAHWTSLSLPQRFDRVAQFVCGMYESRSWLMRAVAIHSRRLYPPASTADASSSPQVRLLERLADCVAVAPLAQDLAREPLKFALYTGMTLAREAILFPRLPMATALGLDAPDIRQRLPGLMQRQLGLRLET